MLRTVKVIRAVATLEGTAEWLERWMQKVKFCSWRRNQYIKTSEKKLNGRDTRLDAKK